MTFRSRQISAIILTFLISVSICHAEESVSNEASAENCVPADTSLRIEVDHGLTFIGLIMTHKALRNSKLLHSWPLFGFATPAAWNSAIKLEKDFSKLLTLKSAAGAAFSFAGLTLSAETSLAIMHLLELGIQGNVGSAINYGDAATFMGVYDPEKRDFSHDIFMTEFTYGFKYKASLTIPLVAFLPKSNWTKIILKPTASFSYNAYTGADDGEVWKAGAENSINGFKYSYGGVLIYLLPFSRVPMAMISANVGGFKHAYDFDEAYADYDPAFKSISITPMLSLNISEKWNGMVMASFSRDRKYENYRYEPTEEILQKRIGSEWGAKTIICTLTRKF